MVFLFTSTLSSVFRPSIVSEIIVSDIDVYLYLSDINI